MEPVLIGVLVGVAVVVVSATAFALRRRARDDEHSVEHYHRRLHTLEELGAHEAARREQVSDEGHRPTASFPVSAVRIAGSSHVGVRVPDARPVPPVPAPARTEQSGPIAFDDTVGGPEPIPRSFMSGADDPVMHSINRRPRRLGGPIAVVAVVVVLVVVLIVTGLHATTTGHAHRSSGTGAAGRGGGAASSSPVPPPVVSGPTAASAHRAVYRVAVEDYALTLAATAAGPCPVAAGVPAHKRVLFSGSLPPGEEHTLTVRGGVTVIAGSVSGCAVSVNSTAVALPAGARTPLTLVFWPAPAG